MKRFFGVVLATVATAVTVSAPAHAQPLSPVGAAEYEFQALMFQNFRSQGDWVPKDYPTWEHVHELVVEARPNTVQPGLCRELYRDGLAFLSLRAQYIPFPALWFLCSRL